MAYSVDLREKAVVMIEKGKTKVATAFENLLCIFVQLPLQRKTS